MKRLEEHKANILSRIGQTLKERHAAMRWRSKTAAVLKLTRHISDCKQTKLSKGVEGRSEGEGGAEECAEVHDSFFLMRKKNLFSIAKL